MEEDCGAPGFDKETDVTGGADDDGAVGTSGADGDEAGRTGGADDKEGATTCGVAEGPEV